MVEAESHPYRLLLSPKDASKALAISPRKLWSLTAGGEIKCVRIGRLVRYDPDDLREYVESVKEGAS